MSNESKNLQEEYERTTGYRVGVDRVRVTMHRIEGNQRLSRPATWSVRVNGIEVETGINGRSAALDVALMARRVLECAGLDVDLRRE